MDFPNPSISAGNLVGSIKDKLNLGSRNAKRGEYYEEEFDIDEYGYDAEYDDFDEYGEYGFDESYTKGSYSDAYSDGYTTRDPLGSRAPRLVSTEDIRRTTSAFGVDAPTMSSAATSSQSVSGYLSNTADTRFSSRTNNRVMETLEDQDGDAIGGRGFDRPDTGYADFVSPYQRHTAANTEVMPSTGSAGLDGLFTPTDGSAAAPAESSSSKSFGGRYSRKVEVFEPKNFEEAVDIVTMLNEGSVVVLNLKYVNAGLSKRILDFSFGVVAAMGATITYEAPQVFTITTSGKLTLVEKDQLRIQRVL